MPGTWHIPPSTPSRIRHRQQLGSQAAPGSGSQGQPARAQGPGSCRARADGAAEGSALGDRWPSLSLPWCPPSPGAAHGILRPLLLRSSILPVQQAPHDSPGTDPVADGGSAHHTLSVAQPPGSLEVTVHSLVVLSPPHSPLPSLATAVGWESVLSCSPRLGGGSQSDSERAAGHRAVSLAGTPILHWLSPPGPGRVCRSCVGVGGVVTQPWDGAGTGDPTLVAQAQ